MNANADKNTPTARIAMEVKDQSYCSDSLSVNYACMHLHISVISVHMFDKMYVCVHVCAGGGGYKDEKCKF